MILNISCIFLAVISFGECIPYKSAQIGGDGGDFQTDDVRQYSLENGEIVFRLENILLWGSDQEPIPTFEASYVLLNVLRGGTQWSGKRGRGDTGDARHFLILSNGDVVERMYGYYGSLTDLHNGVHLINHIGFDIRRSNGNLEFFGAGIKRGANVTVLGPIVGFYAGVGGAIDFVGCYVDPSWWPDRPSRLVMYPAAGKTFGDGTEYSFDHNVQLGEPFVLRIAKLVIYHSPTLVNGLQVVYENHLREQFTVSDGTTSGGNLTLTFEIGDYIKLLEVTNDIGSSTDNCLAGMKLTVSRGEGTTEEAYYIATTSNLKSTEGPVVAFYGLIQGTNLCLSRLGGYRLLDSSEFSKTCVLPDIPTELVMNEIPERIGQGTILTFSCADLSEEIAQESVLVCGSDGIWRGEFPKCSIPCLPLEPFSNGSILYSDDRLEVAIECNYGFVLDGPEYSVCSNGTWSEDGECIYGCLTPIPPRFGAYVNTSTSYPPGTKLQYTCEQGYAKGTTSELMCEVDGTWSGGQPLCVEEVLIGCQTPPPPANGAYVNTSTSYPPGTKLQYTCEQGYEKGTTSELTCEVDGTWSGGQALCMLIDAACTSTPTPPTNGYFLNVALAYKAGHRLIYECNDGYKISGSDALTCEASGEWTGEAVCSLSDTTDPPGTPSIPCVSTESTAEQQSAQEVWTNCYIINLPGVIIIIILLVVNIAALFVAIVLCLKWRIMGSQNEIGFDEDGEFGMENPLYVKSKDATEEEN